MRLIALSLVLGTLCFAAPASAQDAASEIRQLYTTGLENYDFFEYDAAEQSFEQAITVAKASNSRDPIVAKVYVAKGILFFARFKDTAPEVANDKTFDEFVAAVSIDYNVAIPDDYRSTELDEILAKAREIVPPPHGGGGGGGGGRTSGSVSITHSATTVADACEPIALEATVPAHPEAYRVHLHYRPADGVTYESIELEPGRSNSELFAAQIPIEATAAATVDYYIEVTNRQQASVASVGTRSQPNTITVIGECELPSSSTPIVHIAIEAGTGVGLADGMSERCNSTPDCYSGPDGTGDQSRFEGVKTGLAPAPFHLKGELMFNVVPQVQVGAYVRMQLVEFATMFGVAARYFILNDASNRLYTGLGIGYGDATYVVNLGPEFNNFRDVVRAEGPAHIGFNLGYAIGFTENIGLIFDVYAPIHFPEFTFHFDVSAGPYVQF